MITDSLKEYDIAVLIPHFNNLTGLDNSLKSISFNGSLIVVIVDDGSSQNLDENGLDLVLRSKGIDLKIIYSESNEGIEHALNIGLVFIQREIKVLYLARLDCGDLMTNSRLEKQYGFLQNNAFISLIGSSVGFFSKNEILYKLKVPTEHEEISRQIMLQVCFIHPSVMFRVDILEKVGFYPTDFPAAEDYAFFMEIVRTLKTANLPEVLTLVEKNTDGISLTKRRIQLKSRLRVLIKYKKFSIYFLLGVLKVLILMVLPYRIIFFIKRLIYR